MFKLAHLSDIHLPYSPIFSVKRFAGKRITGYLNWKFNRKHSLGGAYLETLLAGLKVENLDHTIISGDITNLSLEEEFEHARQFLEQLGSPETLTVQFGNHDAYVPGALGNAMKAWRPYASGDEKPLASADNFPIVRILGDVALICCNSAEATLPFFATGYFRADQAERLGQILDAHKDKCRIVSIHHPPIAGAAKHHKRLIGQSLFAEKIRQHGADLALHGHTHLDTIHHLPGPSGDIPVVCVPAAGNSHGGHRPAGRYNLFSITPENDGWSITLEAKACAHDLSGVETVHQQVLK